MVRAKATVSNVKNAAHATTVPMYHIDFISVGLAALPA